MPTDDGGSGALDSTRYDIRRRVRGFGDREDGMMKLIKRMGLWGWVLLPLAVLSVTISLVGAESILGKNPLVWIAFGCYASVGVGFLLFTSAFPCLLAKRGPALASSDKEGDLANYKSRNQGCIRRWMRCPCVCASADS